MKAVFRIALGAFSFVPLQRVLNPIGVAIALAALAWELLRPASAPIATLFLMMGVLLVTLTPAFGGGAALRYASTPSVLHLRPHGRLHMLLGSALAITLISVLVALPMFLLEWLQPRGARLSVPGGTLLPIIGLSTTLVWVCMFSITGGRKQLIPLVFLIPYVLPPILKFVGTSSLGVVLFALVAVAALLGFPVWYSRTDTVRRPGMNGETPSWGGRANFLESETGPMPSRTRILRQYLLGYASLTTPILSSFTLVVFMALLAAMPMFMGKARSGLNPFLFVMIAALGVLAATMGHMTARRARLLWLRAGLNRAELFSLAQREGLLSTALAYVIPLSILLAAAIYLQPDLTPAHLAFGVANLASAVCLFHAGLSTTHDWDLGDFALMAGMVALQILLAVLTLPDKANSINWCAGFTAGYAVLTVILRGYARERWLQLDWRVMRMPQTRR